MALAYFENRIVYAGTFLPGRGHGETASCNTGALRSTACYSCRDWQVGAMSRAGDYDTSALNASPHWAGPDEWRAGKQFPMECCQHPLQAQIHFL